jgi:hypothetical protein
MVLFILILTILVERNNVTYIHVHYLLRIFELINQR